MLLTFCTLTYVPTSTSFHNSVYSTFVAMYVLGDLTPEEEFQIGADRSGEKNKKHAKVKLHFADVILKKFGLGEDAKLKVIGEMGM